MNTKYLTNTWQGLLQMIVFLVGHGYHYYHIEYLPAKKQDKYVEIDRKIITKYQTEKTKYQRAYAKRKKLANFMYLRWENIAIILHTNGSFAEGIIADDKFNDVKHQPIFLKISDLVAFDIQFVNKKGQAERTVTVRMSREMYQGQKDHLFTIAQTKSKKIMIAEYDKLNGLPAWAGIIAQKRRLAQHLVKMAEKNFVQLEQRELRINDKRKIVSIW